jgi:putative transposase
VAIAEAARSVGVSEVTLYCWKSEYVVADGDANRRLKELGKDYARLERLVAAKEFDIRILKEVADRVALIGPPLMRVGAW